jgi:tetratricopeptide (TPR) repeat protein
VKGGGGNLTVEVITKQEITKLLNDWYQEMRVQHAIKARKLKEEIDCKIDRIEEDQDLLIYYSLLDFRHQMLTGDFKADFTQPISEQQTNIFLKYYYHFFKFIYFMEIGNYSDAKNYYEIAEELLADIPDEAEKAEFNYRVAIFNYYVSQPVLSIHYAIKAQDFFAKHEGYEVKIGACKNLLGTACTILEQYEIAEEYLLDALDIFQKANEHSLVIKVRHNLGLLYADQDLSEVAIRHLTDVFNENRRIRATYLLAREHYKLKRTQEASKYIEEGMKSCSEEYKYHFSVLKAKNDNLPVGEAEGIFLSAIEYLKKREMWKDVIMYNKELANKWFDAGDKEKAITYFRMGYEAKQTLHKKGTLK